MITVLSTAARKAWVGAAISFLGPLGVLLAATNEPLSVRAVLTAVVSGLIGGLSVFYTRNAKVRRATTTGRHEKPRPTS
jgi:hypothetical protein